MSNTTLENIIGTALSQYCKDSVSPDDCKKYKDIVIGGDKDNPEISFNNGEDDFFTLSCERTGNQLQCKLMVERYKEVGGGCLGGPTRLSPFMDETGISAYFSPCSEFQNIKIDYSKSPDTPITKDYEIPNFPQTVTFYFGKEMSDENRAKFIEKFNIAAEETATIADSYYGLSPAFNSLMVYVKDSECIDVGKFPDKSYTGGSAYGNQITISPLLDNDKGCSYDSYFNEGEGNFPIGIIGHELFHFYAFPGLYEPNTILNEANAENVRDGIVADMEGSSIDALFPWGVKNGVDARYIESFELKKGDIIEIADQNGKPIPLKFEEALAPFVVDGVTFLFGYDTPEGKKGFVGLTEGYCSSDHPELFVCLDGAKNGGYYISVFTKDDVVNRKYIYLDKINPEEYATSLPLAMFYGQTPYIKKVFIEEPFTQGEDPNFLSSVGKKLEKGEQYKNAAYFLAGLTEMFFKYNVGEHPNGFFMGFGNRIKGCRETALCDDIATWLSDLTRAPLNEIKKYFASFGLNPNPIHPIEECYPFE